MKKVKNTKQIKKITKVFLIITMIILIKSHIQTIMTTKPMKRNHIKTIKTGTKIINPIPIIAINLHIKIDFVFPLIS